MADISPIDWDAAKVRKWLDARIAASRSDQVAAERAGYGQHDDCDKATAEEMVCTLMQARDSVVDQKRFATDLKALLERDEFIWRGVYDDTRFDRHVRSYVRKLAKMAKTNSGFDRTTRYQ